MSEIAERYRKVAAEFTRRVEAVAPGDWDRPAPCEGWVARDVVDHLVEWVPSMLFDRWDVEWQPGPLATEDPVAAWSNLDTALQAALKDPAVAEREADTQMGRRSFQDTLRHDRHLGRAGAHVGPGAGDGAGRDARR